MRTETQMLELVRTKLGRRRRRRRTAAASAGGGLAGALLVVVLLAGGPGRQGAVDDVKTGPGPGGASTTTTTTDGGERPAESSSTTTTIAPPTTAPDAGAGASGAGSTGGGGPDGPSGEDPGGGSPDGSSGGPPTTGSGGSPTTSVTGGGPAPTTTTTTTTTPAQPFVHDQTAGSVDDLQFNVRVTSDPSRPGVAYFSVLGGDPHGAAVYPDRRYGPSVVISWDPSGTAEMGDPGIACDESLPYTIEPGLVDEQQNVAMPSGWTTVTVTATSLWCHDPHGDYESITFDVFVP